MSTIYFLFFNRSKKVGEPFAIKVKLTPGASVNSLFYFVVSRNRIIEVKRVFPEIIDYTTMISIAATNEMTPTCHVIVYYFNPEGEIVYDHIKLENEISFSPKVQTF